MYIVYTIVCVNYLVNYWTHTKDLCILIKCMRYLSEIKCVMLCPKIYLCFKLMPIVF